MSSCYAPCLAGQLKNRRLRAAVAQSTLFSAYCRIGAARPLGETRVRRQRSFEISKNSRAQSRRNCRRRKCLNANRYGLARDRATFIVADGGIMYSSYFRPPRILPPRTRRRGWNRGWTLIYADGKRTNRIARCEVATPMSAGNSATSSRSWSNSSRRAPASAGRLGFMRAGEEAARTRAASMISEMNRIPIYRTVPEQTLPTSTYTHARRRHEIPEARMAHAATSTAEEGSGTL